MKWVTSLKKGANRKLEGAWHGAHSVKLGFDASHFVLQECMLFDDWVEEEFSPTFLDECKRLAIDGTSRRFPKNCMSIPAGDVIDDCLDPPPQTEVMREVRVAFQQGKEDSCLRHSLASALSAMGFAKEAIKVA